MRVGEARGVGNVEDARKVKGVMHWSVWLQELVPGDYFGTSAILGWGERLRHSTMEAVTDVQVHPRHGLACHLLSPLETQQAIFHCSTPNHNPVPNPDPSPDPNTKTNTHTHP